MRRKTILPLATLLLTPFLFSCNKVSYTVNKEQYESAMANEGVEYLQLVILSLSSFNTTTADYTLSPNSIHLLLKVDAVGTISEEETYITKNDNHRTMKSRSTNYPDWVITTSDDPNEILWFTPQDLSAEKLLYKFTLLEKIPKFEELDYDDDNKQYTATLENLYELKQTLSIKFINKRIKEFTLKHEYEPDYKETFTYSYKQIVPQDPTK